MACSVVKLLLYFVLGGLRHSVRAIGWVGDVTLIDWVAD